jgi:hypothetical protein
MHDDDQSPDFEPANADPRLPIIAMRLLHVAVLFGAEDDPNSRALLVDTDATRLVERLMDQRCGDPERGIPPRGCGFLIRPVPVMLDARMNAWTLQVSRFLELAEHLRTIQEEIADASDIRDAA